MTQRKPPEKKEPIRDGRIIKTWKFWKRGPKLDKKHECEWLEEVNRLMEEKANHDCGVMIDSFKVDSYNIKFFAGDNTLKIYWEIPDNLVDWLHEVLAVKKWKNKAEQQYFLKFEFTEN